jgi:hypothetical protein
LYILPFYLQKINKKKLKKTKKQKKDLPYKNKKKIKSGEKNHKILFTNKLLT